MRIMAVLHTLTEFDSINEMWQVSLKRDLDSNAVGDRHVYIRVSYKVQ